MRQTNSYARMQLHLLHPSPQPTCSVGHVHTQFLQSFNIVLGGEGAATHFKKESSAFTNSVLMHAMSQVSQGILSTIVAGIKGKSSTRKISLRHQ